MTDNKKAQSETETILMALDQISQTIDVMTSVVGRLRTYLQEQNTTTHGEKTAKQSMSAAQDNRTLH